MGSESICHVKARRHTEWSNSDKNKHFEDKDHGSLSNSSPQQLQRRNRKTKKRGKGLKMPVFVDTKPEEEVI